MPIPHQLGVLARGTPGPATRGNDPMWAGSCCVSLKANEELQNFEFYFLNTIKPMPFNSFMLKIS